MQLHDSEIFEFAVLYEITKSINGNLELNSMLQSIYEVLYSFIGVDDLPLWRVQPDNQKLKLTFTSKGDIDGGIFTELDLGDALENELVDETLAFVYQDGRFISVNKDYQQDDSIIPVESTFFLPLIERKKIIGILGFDRPAKLGRFFTLEHVMLFTIIATQISTAIINDKLKNQIMTNATISVATKEIAKIIETQHELEYVIPIMGEIMDKHIMNALVYIFLRDKERGFKISWPNAYSKNTVDPLLQKMLEKGYPVISDTRKIIALPLMYKNDLIGAVVADGKIDELWDEEIEFLNELVKQCSITIHRANSYAETVKHATIDALTSLDNRRQLDKRLLQEASIVIRTGRAMAILLIDVDFFKSVNDTHGHSVGDYVLKEIAGIIRKTIREYDIAGRYGGEEFAVLLPDTRMLGAKILAERLRVAVENNIINIGKYSSSKADTISVTISIGIAEYNSTDKSPADLYEEADIALYRAKQDGRNRVILFSD